MLYSIPEHVQQDAKRLGGFYHVELTDTFGGDANYSYVYRCSFADDGTTENSAVLARALERLAELYDLSFAETELERDAGDCIRYDFVGANECIIISYYNAAVLQD